MDNMLAVLGFLLLVSLVALPVGCQVNRDIIHTKAIASSIDPIATSCALDSTDRNGNSKAICTLAASRTK